MKKLFVTALTVALAFSLTSCGEKAKTETPAGEEVVANGEENVMAEGENAPEVKPEKRRTGKKLRNVSDSISYAIGADIANAIKAQKADFDTDFNLNYFLAGIKETFKEKSTLLEEEIRPFIQRYYMEVIPERNLVKGQEFLAKVEKETPGIQKTDSGLLYIVENPGSDVKALSLKDTVEVQYVGTLKDGTEFDSSQKRGKAAKFPLGGVIKGWGEGMQLVGEGGKIKLWIPSELAYGKMGGGRAIKPNEPVMFEVELVKVYPGPAEEVTEAAK